MASVAEVARMTRLYESGLSLAKVGKRVGRCRSGVHDILRDAGVEMRGVGKAQIPVVERACGHCGRMYGPERPESRQCRAYHREHSKFCTKRCRDLHRRTRTCQCGCGEWPGGHARRYVPGHRHPLSDPWRAYLRGFDRWIVNWRDPKRRKPKLPVKVKRSGKPLRTYPELGDALALLA